MTAMRFTNQEGVSRYGRYRMVPESGIEHLSADEAKTKQANFLFDEIKQRVASGPVGFRILVQLAD